MNAIEYFKRECYKEYKSGVEKRGGSKIMPFFVFEIVFVKMLDEVEARFPHSPATERFKTAMNICIKTTIDFEKSDGDFVKYLISKQSEN